MKIHLLPQRRDDKLSLVKQGDALIVNGEVFDFAQLPEGGILPAEAVPSQLFRDEVWRVGGEIVVTMLLPIGPNPTDEEAFPAVIHAVDGPIALPGEYND